MMEWTCSQCGQYAEVDVWRELARLGWTLTATGDCVCASCTARQWPAGKRSRRDSDLPARDVARRQDASIAAADARQLRIERPHPYLVLVK